ncbi:MAG: branched-chain amino acid aminotransferase [Candidatus Bathyarchaeota archaeon BA1]|nr:MAG: branched-chain amino acid aminotransferase [Candidatus Bathyarchaeota archaeon BA1]
MKKSGYTWFNGRFVPWDEAKTHVLDHGIHYGTGIFEGIRAYKTQDGNSAIFRLEKHVERMFKSAEILQMKIPYEKRMIEEAIIETVRKNRMMECYVRPLVWYGYGEIGAYVRNLPVNVMVAAWEWETYLGKEALEVAFGQRLAHG